MAVVVVIGAVGAVLLAIALKMYMGVRAQRGRGVRLVGEVASHGEYVSHGQTMFYPIYAATLPDGKRVEGQAATTMAKTWRSPKVGSKRTIIYRAGEDPPFSELGFVPLLPALIMGALGAGMMVGAIALAFAQPHHIDHSAADRQDAIDRKRERDEKREQRREDRDQRRQERDERRATP
jgi:hypothetical protein